MKLDLGCGKNKHPNYIGIDKRRFENVDLVIDLDKEALPFSDNSIDEVLLYNVLEHLESPYRVMREVIRVCKNGAIIRIKFPFLRHKNAYLDTEHKYILLPEWFRLFKELKIKKVKLHYPSPVLGRLFPFLWPPDEFYIELEVVKDACKD